MRRLLPHPLSTLLIMLFWMMLNRFSLGHLLLGGLVGVAGGWALSKIEEPTPRIKHIWPMVKLFFIVFVDIIRSNIAVARLILTRGRQGTRRSDFVEIPLRLNTDVQLAILAIIVTATPGTAWIEFDSERKILLLHVFDLREGEDWRHFISTRYEQLLLEGFGNDQ